MNNCYRYLDIPVELINKKLIVDRLFKDEGTTEFQKVRMWKFQDQILNSQFYNWLDSVGCSVHQIEIFHTPANGTLPWHVDQTPGINVVKINLIWNSEDHEMQWGECVNNQKLINLDTTPMNTKYVAYDDAEIAITERTTLTIDTPVLVNVGQPHRVLNYSDTSRWCLSIVIHKDKQRILFEDAIKIFSEYVVD
jgi:hypothetical protein